MLKPYSDVYLVSYPRSGNTWLRLLLATIIEPSEVWTVQSVDRVVPDMYRVPLSEIPPPRIIKSHERFDAGYGRAIYLCRDGRDVALSYFDFYRKQWHFRGDFGRFLRRFLIGRVHFGCWQDHIASWLDAADQTRFLLIRYEDLYADPCSHLRKIADFAGLKTEDKGLDEAVNRCTWEAYRQDVLSDPRNSEVDYQGGIIGRPGMWREAFCDKEIEAFWAVAGQSMSRLQYSRV